MNGPAEILLSDANHNAFPGYTNLADDTKMIIYRKATAHSSTDGVIELLAGPTVIYDDDTLDVRDPSITLLSNGDLIISFFKWDGEDAKSCYTIKSDDDGATWSAPVEITNAFTAWSAISSPIIELANGDLVAAVYGRDIGDTRDSAVTVISNDAGATWGSEAEIDPVELNTDFQEPNILLLSNGDILALLRTTSNEIYRSVSTDSGATWSYPVVCFPGSGSPRISRTTSDIVVCVYRSIANSNAVVRASLDNGQNWSAETLLDDDGNSMTYGAMQELDTGNVKIVYGMETYSNPSVLRSLELTIE